MINYNRKIEGLCFVEDVYNNENNKKSNLIFDNNCNLILLANKYIKYFRKTQSGSYCTINRIARDLCCLYNFLLISNINIIDIDLKRLEEFAGYLKIIKVRRVNEFDNDFIKNKFSIERTLWELTQVVTKGKIKNSNVIELRAICGLDSKSIYRIFNRAILYLKELYKNDDYLNDNTVNFFKKEKDIKNFLKAQGIEIRRHEITPVDPEMVFFENEICAIEEQCSTTYERFLYFLLERTGIRIGEALGIKIINYDRNNLRAIKSDLKYEDNRWTINICWREENPFYCRTKAHRARDITLKESETPIFELLLERYLKWRMKKVKKDSSQWLFISMRGNHLTQNVAYSKFKATLDKAGIGHRRKMLTLHSYRHTFATLEFKKGVPLQVISKLLGHQKSKTTEQLYIHFANKDIVKMREDIDRKLEEDFNGNI